METRGANGKARRSCASLGFENEVVDVGEERRKFLRLCCYLSTWVNGDVDVH